MNNFMDFIIEDITVKKELLSTMPLNNKTNIKKYNEKIATMQEKYKNYKKAIYAYINEVNKNLKIEQEDNKVDAINEKIKILETGLKYFNPFNTAIEKCGIGGLTYNIKYYNDFTFDSMNRIIEAYITKFEEAGVYLQPEEFQITPYTREYMDAFLENRKKYGKDNYDALSLIFEKIYWKDPDLLKQIALDFRDNIEKYIKEFETLVIRKQKEFTAQYKFKNYDECMVTLEKAYEKLYEEDKETIYDIIQLARDGLIDINNYKEDSKIRNDVLQELIIDYSNSQDEDSMEKIYHNLALLKRNIQEYIDYSNIVPLIDFFKTNYETTINHDKEKVEDKKKNDEKNVSKFIEEKRKELNEINKLIYKGKKGFKKLKDKELEELKEKSINAASELRKAIKIQDNQILMERVLKVLKQPVTIENILFVFYCFDYMKRDAIRKVYHSNISMDEMVHHYKKFDSFALNPTHFIVNNLTAYEESNINSIIVDNYRIKGINITEENLKPENLEELLNKIKMILRIGTINKSSITAEEIWFILQVEKIIAKEKKNEEAS